MAVPVWVTQFMHSDLSFVLFLCTQELNHTSSDPHWTRFYFWKYFKKYFKTFDAGLFRWVLLFGSRQSCSGRGAAREDAVQKPADRRRCRLLLWKAAATCRSRCVLTERSAKCFPSERKPSEPTTFTRNIQMLRVLSQTRRFKRIVLLSTRFVFYRHFPCVKNKIK